MSRWWNEVLGAYGALLYGGVMTLFLLMFLATLIIALLWYFWPAWWPSNWLLRWRRGEGSRGSRTDEPRWRFRFGRIRWRLRWRRRKRRGTRALADLELAPDELPDLPAAVLALTADQLAAAGRFAEAVRERLRAIIRELIEREVLPLSPGWTVMELAAAATRARPDLGGPLRDACDVFSEIWYGLRPATAADDAAMREHAARVRRLLDQPAHEGMTPASTATGGNG